MKTPAAPDNNLFDASSTLACFDGENLQNIKALREFFEQGGMVVQENSNTSTHCLYQVVFGSSNTVKAILSRNLRPSFRLLILLTNGTKEEAMNLAHFFNAGVAVIGDGLTGPAEARDVFGFLCTNITSAFMLDNLRISDKENQYAHTLHNEPPIKKADETKRPTVDLWETDKVRINKEIEEIYTPKKGKQFDMRPTAKYLSRMVLFSAISFVFLFVVSFIFATTSLYVSSRKFVKNTWASSLLLSTANMVLSTEKQLVSDMGTAISITPIRTFERILSMTQQGSQLLSAEQALAKEFPINSFLDQTSPHSNKVYYQLPSVVSQTTTILQTIDAVRADVKLLVPSFFPQVFKPFSSRILTKLDNLSLSVSTLKAFAGLYPLLAPGDEKKTYLLLFQNSNELRPTGGFIGSLGYVTFQNGKVSEIDIEDVYTVDGQLRGHVDPPLPIRHLLNQEHWYLRDSNWNPDFESSGLQAAWFLNKSINKQVDGVIAINLPFLEDLLSLTGPVTIADSKEALSKETVAQVIEDTVKENFFPGSTTKKDLLQTINFALLEKLKRGEVSPEKLLTLVSQHLKKKNLLLFSSDQSINHRLRSLGWMNSFSFSPLCTVPSCEESIISPVETNLSVSKINKRISRDFRREITIPSTTKLETKDTLTITNGVSSSEAGDTYTTYVRLYYPQTSTITAVSLGNSNLFIHEASASARPVPYAEILQEQDGLVTVGVALKVSNQESVQLQVSSVEVVDPLTSYRVRINKQPGIEHMPVTIVGTIPEDWEASVGNLPNSASFVARKGIFEYTTDVDRDTAISFYFNHP